MVNSIRVTKVKFLNTFFFKFKNRKNIFINLRKVWTKKNNFAKKKTFDWLSAQSAQQSKRATERVNQQHWQNHPIVTWNSSVNSAHHLNNVPCFFSHHNISTIRSFFSVFDSLFLSPRHPFKWQLRYGRVAHQHQQFNSLTTKRWRNRLWLGQLFVFLLVNWNFFLSENENFDKFWP